MALNRTWPLTGQFALLPSVSNNYRAANFNTNQNFIRLETIYYLFEGIQY